MFAQRWEQPRQKSGRSELCSARNARSRWRWAFAGVPERRRVDMIRDLVSSDPALNQAAWENLRGTVRLLEAGEGVAEPEPRSDAW